MTTQENPLERALRAAADDPSSRPDFYQLLVNSEVFVISGTSHEVHSVRTVQAGEQISIQNWQRADGSPVIPFFTSLEALQRALTEPSNYMCLPARSLFEITKGATLFLNPKLDYGKEFFPNEIEALLVDGVTRLPETRVTQKATKVLLGQPKERPTVMIDALTSFFAKRSQVVAAYLLLMHDTSLDQQPHLVVGIRAEGEFETLLREAGVVAADTAPKGEPVDLYRVVPTDKGLSVYFLESVEPFYTRNFGTKLRGLFGAGRA